MRLILISSVILFMLAFFTSIMRKEISKNKFIIINVFIIFLTLCLMIYNIFIEYSFRKSVALLMVFTINSSVAELYRVWFKKIKILFLLLFILLVLFVIYIYFLI